MISVHCPQCERHYRIKPELAGRTIRCKDCGEKFHIPSAEPGDDVADARPSGRATSSTRRAASPARDPWEDDSGSDNGDAAADLPATRQPLRQPARKRSRKRGGAGLQVPGWIYGGVHVSF